MIFKAVGDGRPYPEHGLVTPKEWAAVAPRQVRLDQLVTTRAELDLHSLLSSDSTFFGDLFAHVVRWRGTFYLEDGLHRALRAALQQRTVIHARVLDLDDPDHPTGSQQVIDAPVRTPLGDAPPPPPRTSLPPPPPPPRSSDHRVPRRSLADRRPRGRRT
ncbi:MAG: type II toxin-antitoxin system VapB family antitoxin [Actinomycetaceae bacterium]